jgi:hypothetical protein
MPTAASAMPVDVAVLKLDQGLPARLLPEGCLELAPDASGCPDHWSVMRGLGLMPQDGLAGHSSRL